TLSNNNPGASFKKKIDSLKRHHVLIGIAGRFVEEKGFDILLRAMPKILKHVPHAHIVFAGAKRMEYEPFFDKHKTLIQKHKQNVTFLGLLEAPDLTYFYKKLDVFIISSRSDCFPLTQIEAALAGVPIVCTDIPGARMLVRETGAGKIVSVKDTALASGTAEVMKDNDKFSNRQNQVRKFLKRYEAFTL
ncbi:MAG: glycosyltransferase family 4 protein, partial [Candidatus Paceibacterota bacterium]